MARDRLGIKPLYLARGARRAAAALRLDAARAAGGRRRRSRRAPGGAAPLSDVSRGGARAVHHPGRRQEAAGRHRAHHRARRRRARPGLLATHLLTRPRARRLVGAAVAGRHPAGPAAGGEAPHGGRRSHRGAAVRWHRLERHRGAAGPGRAAGPEDVQRRLRGRGRHERGRVPLLRPGGARLRHRSPPATHRQSGPGPGGGGRHRRDERAHGQPRRGGLLPAFAAGGEAREGGAVGAGRGGGLRGVRVVPALAISRAPCWSRCAPR